MLSLHFIICVCLSVCIWLELIGLISGVILTPCPNSCFSIISGDLYMLDIIVIRGRTYSAHHVVLVSRSRTRTKPCGCTLKTWFCLLGLGMTHKSKQNQSHLSTTWLWFSFWFCLIINFYKCVSKLKLTELCWFKYNLMVWFYLFCFLQQRNESYFQNPNRADNRARVRT